jgi:aryl-phospho-beta-D-glucosidase BglC (GH1 family)
MHRSAAAVFLSIALIAGIAAQGPVSRHGQLSVSGGKLVDRTGAPVQLKGLSLFDATKYKEFATKELMEWLRDEWGMGIFRIALYTELDGYFIGRRSFSLVRAYVDACVAADVYALIDWHILNDGDPNKFKAEAKEFFAEMAAAYGHLPNVLYEICNEPNGSDVTWAGHVKPYAEEMIAHIRGIDPDGVIVVGPPSFTHAILDAVADPLMGDNLMYSFHFYAGSHGEEYRKRVERALEAGHAVMISEFGTTNNEGTGPVYPAETRTWIEWANRLGLTWINWSVTERLEGSAVNKPGASYEGSWSDGDLTESGLLVRRLMRSEAWAPVFAESFESGSFLAGGWVRDNAGLDRSSAFKGSSSATIKEREALTRAVDLSAYEDVKLTITYRTEGAGAPGAFRLDWFDGEKWMVGKLLEPSDEWVTRRFAFPASANGNPNFAFRLKGAALSGEKAWFDEISLGAALR